MENAESISLIAVAKASNQISKIWGEILIMESDFISIFALDCLDQLRCTALSLSTSSSVHFLVY